MTNWHADACALRSSGATYAEIAARFGVTTSAAWKAVNANVTRDRNAADRDRRRARRRETDRARAERMRATCDTCGQPCGKGSAAWSGHEATRCQACRSALHEARDARLVELYESGLPLKDIAPMVGWTLGGLARQLSRLRREGRIGYRYKGWEAEAA